MIALTQDEKVTLELMLTSLNDELNDCLSADGPADIASELQKQYSLLRKVATHLAAPAVDIDAMVNSFLGWPLPQSVLPDLCVMNQDYPTRSGTNLLTAVEAKAMFQHCLQAAKATGETE